MADAGKMTLKVNTVDGMTGEPIPFATLQTLAIRCGPTQHDYWQGQDAMDHEEDELRRLLFCRQCGDVIRLELPREESVE